MNPISNRLWVATGAALAAVGLAGNGSAAPARLVFAQLAPSISSGPGTTTLRPVERAFLTEATAAGRTATEVSRLAVSQATASTVRDFAQQLVGDYSQINRDLEALARRKQLALAPSPASYSDEYKQLAARSGEDFDRAYILEAAEVSQRALRVCEKAVADAKDSDVRELAGNLLPILRNHSNKITELKKSL